MPNDSRRTVLVSLGAGLGVGPAKAGAAAFTGSRHGRRGVACPSPAKYCWRLI
jgi:hypothetical protein